MTIGNNKLDGDDNGNYLTVVTMGITITNLKLKLIFQCRAANRLSKNTDTPKQFLNTDRKYKYRT